MNFRRFFLWISVIILVQIVGLVCYFQGKLSLSPLRSSASIAMSDRTSKNLDQVAIIGELEKMWQEKLIDDLFRDVDGKTTIRKVAMPDNNEKAQQLIGNDRELRDSLIELDKAVRDYEEKVENLVRGNNNKRVPKLRDDLDRNVINEDLIEENFRKAKMSVNIKKAPQSAEENPDKEAKIQMNHNIAGDELQEAEVVKDSETAEETFVDRAPGSKQEEQNLYQKDSNAVKNADAVQDSDSVKDSVIVKDSDTVKDAGAVKDSDISTVQEKPKLVFVMTQARHGSTWLLDMLGYRDNAVPVFEPLNMSGFLKMYALAKWIRDETKENGFDPVKHEDWREVILARICLCDWHGRKVPDPPRKDFHYGGILGLWYKDKRLHPERKGRRDTTPMMEKCEEKGSMMVPKTIRYYNMSTLYRIQDFGCDNFKVIHLVRDPRAVMNSRMNVFHELFDGSHYLGDRIDASKGGQSAFNESYMVRAAEHMCSHHLYNYKFAMNPPPWLKGRYKMVRYEDLAEAPQRWAREILHFVGVKFTAQYKQYVYNTTHVKDRGLKDTGTYGVERQTSDIVNEWKKKLIEPHWRTIERVCADMMKTFNYEPTFFKPEL